ncbi:HEAT repeat domain-containing protein [Gordonia phthalatica]|uniref:HEAT repeat-containing protein n=1 Tax=Gordonia phthalatica TaxID=1136941 RepID=A0A0N9NM71_9ACTN|nr:HEAT repeat domain-containing protein [Gordonia phthalatica]ALG86925.1 hypothetical protein ACH46_14555 [Gordonia phthalatica]
MTDQHTRTDDVIRALRAPSSTTRLRAALAAGTDPEPRCIAVLIERCGVEPDFYVRDMLTWALTRHDVDTVLPAVTAELTSPNPQARSQALHTISKLGDPESWTPTVEALMTDPDDEVARTAWRVAAALAPATEVRAVAAILTSQFGRGGPDVHRSLSRAFAEIGDAALPAVRQSQTSSDPVVRGHAVATEALMRDPESSFAFDIDAA